MSFYRIRFPEGLIVPKRFSVDVVVNSLLENNFSSFKKLDSALYDLTPKNPKQLFYNRLAVYGDTALYYQVPYRSIKGREREPFNSEIESFYLPTETDVVVVSHVSEDKSSTIIYEVVTHAIEKSP